MRKSAMVALVLLLSSACASMPTEEKWLLGAVAMDLGTTAYALDHGGREANPLIRGNSKSETILRGVALNALLYWFQRSVIKGAGLNDEKKFWRIVLGIRAPIVGWNLSQIHKLEK